jgi:hypothetical protein
VINEHEPTSTTGVEWYSKSRIWLLSAIILGTVLGAPRLASFGCQSRNESDQNWASRNHPTTDDQVIKLFCKSRLSVASLHDFDDIQVLIANVFRERPFEKVLELLEPSAKNSAVCENAMGVVQLLKLNQWAEDTRSQQIASGEGITQDDLDRYLKTYLEGLSKCFKCFEKAAKSGSKDAMINLQMMADLVSRINDVNPSWNGSVPSDQLEANGADLSIEKQQLRRLALQLLTLLERQEQIRTSVDALINDGYWPALEADLRSGYATNSPLAELEKRALRLSEAKGADEISQLVAAGALIQAAQASGQRPVNKILPLAQNGAREGLWNANWLEAEFHRLNQDAVNFKLAIERGAKVGEPMCLLRQGEACFVAQDYDKSQLLLSQALEKGLIEATCYLGWMSEQGLGTAQDFSKALEYYQTGYNNKIPECAERIGQLYLMGTLKATAMQLDYQIEGLPQLPEPNPLEKQTLANLASAQVYLEKASEFYYAQGDEQQAKSLSETVVKLRRLHETLTFAPTARAYGEWDLEKEDFLLERRFERMIELRDQDRREVERRNEKLNR